MTVDQADADTFLTVALIGVSSRSRAVLDMFFSTQAGHLCRLVDDLAKAQVGIVDLDGPQASTTFAAYRREFQGPTLALSVRDPELDDAVWLAKPVRPTELLAALTAFQKPASQPAPPPNVDAPPSALNTMQAPEADSGSESTVVTEIEQNQTIDQVATNTQAPATEPATTVADDAPPPESASKPASTSVVEDDAKDVRRAAGLAETERRRHPSYGTLDDDIYKDSAQCRRCFYDPMDYFQGALQKALAMAGDEQLPVRIHLQADDRGLTIFPGRHSVQSEIREHLLRSLSMVRGGGDSVTFELLPADTEPASSVGDARLQTEFGLLWKVALWSSLGRAPIGADPQRPVTLLRWPNFTRIFITKHAIPIATLWSQRPTSLLDTARLLGIEHRYVFSFFAATTAVGIVGYVDAADQVQAPDGKQVQRGILGRLLTYLGARD